MLLGIDGKILHLKELGFIERMMFEKTLNPEDFYKQFAKFLTDNHDLQRKQFFEVADLEKVDAFIKSYFLPVIEESKVWLLRAYIIGRFLAKSDITAQVFNIESVVKLPKFVQDAAKKYGLSIEEAKALQSAVNEGASLMSNTAASTIQTVRNAIYESTKKHGGAKDLLKELRELIVDDIGELNRDWKRVAISETNAIFNNGYLALMKPGEYVVGISMPDACDGCLELINGKVYQVRATAPEDYSTLDPRSAKYIELAEIWENEVWVGKNNYGRSNSRQKRIDPNVGNKKDNLREKHHHEHSMPACPQHPNCRCRWIRINPEYQYVNKDGQIKLRVENDDEWHEWYEDNNIKPLNTKHQWKRGATCAR
ncbi:MAG: hypothetical protein RDU14_16595 [Melioribacteraceae bacterium]|nr:hypothetical protein [Melioribacteraceae bacterium]